MKKKKLNGTYAPTRSFRCPEPIWRKYRAWCALKGFSAGAYLRKVVEDAARAMREGK